MGDLVVIYRRFVTFMFDCSMSHPCTLVISSQNDPGNSQSQNIRTCDHVDLDSNIFWINGSHLDLGCIGFVKTEMISDYAETYCSLRGYGHLVEIFNQTQQDFIAQEAK